jgi:hypothetical protein
MGTKVIGNYENPRSLAALRADLLVEINATVKDGHSCLRAEVMGIITSSGLARRRTRSLVKTTAFAANSPNGTVEDGTKYKVGDVLKNAAGTTVGTILTIVGNNITLAANAAVAVAIDAAVYASDGSEVAKFIAEDGSDGVSDTTVTAIVGGYLEESLLIGLDATAKTELGGISLPGGIFKF